MNFLVEKDKIVKILSKIQGLTGKNRNLAVTENVLVSTCKEGLVIKATDLETGFEGHCSAKIEKVGSLSVNSRKLYDILRYFPDSNILVEEIEGRKIRISNNNICYDLFCDNSEYFPEITEMKDAVRFNISAFVLKDIIKKMVIISNLPGEKRAYINGVLLEINKYKDYFLLRMVSTDASRLSTIDYRLEKTFELKQEQKILIPKKGLNEVLKFIDFDETLEIGIKRNVFFVKKQYETVVIRLLEGDFPEYEEITTRESGNLIKLNKHHFSKTLKRMSILANEQESILVLLKKGIITIIAKNTEYGESREEVEINFSGDELEVAFNPKFLLDTLSVIKEDFVYINIVDESKPCIVKGVDNKSFTSVIMPMRI